MKTSPKAVLGWGLAALLVIWAPFPLQLQAQDKAGISESLVRVRAYVPREATTAQSLGAEREGNGIVIDSSGLVLTIGYLIVEADRIEVQSENGTFPADFVGYDGDSGFGLIRARSSRAWQLMALGDSSPLEVGDRLEVGGFGAAIQPVRVISREEFVGYWEYLVDNVLYTAPAFSDFGGAALVREGKLVGVGSILTTFVVRGAGRLACNMFVPIDLLKPILQELVRSGRSGLPARPWLGVNTAETAGRVVVTMVTPGGPADQAGLRPGDLILAVGQQPVSGIGDFYRRVWSVGAAGVSVPLRVLQGETIKEIMVKSIDRMERLRRSPNWPGGVPATPTAWLLRDMRD